MAKDETALALQATIDFPHYEEVRPQCMSGDVANSVDTGKFPFKPVNAERLCMGYIEHSLNMQGKPAALAKDPDHGLLAAYKKIAQNKGLPGTDAQARAVVELFWDTAHANANSYDIVRIPAASLSKDHKYDVLRGATRPFVITPAAAWDAAAVHAYIEHFEKHHPQPKPVATEAQRELAGQFCFRNAGKFGQCSLAGEDQTRAHIYSARNTASR